MGVLRNRFQTLQTPSGTNWAQAAQGILLEPDKQIDRLSPRSGKNKRVSKGNGNIGIEDEDASGCLHRRMRMLRAASTDPLDGIGVL
eukprot:1909099-Amphidinium_carterae.1